MSETLNPPVAVPVTLPKDFGIPQMSALAHDLAVQLYSVSDVLKSHSLSRAQFEHLLKVPVFEQILTQASENWTKPSSVKQRVALQSQLLVEKALPAVGARIQNAKEDLPAVIEGLKLAAKLGGIGEVTQQQGPQERFTINIDFGGAPLVFDTTRATVTLDATAETIVALEPQPEAPASASPVRQVPEGESVQPSPQHVSEGSGGETPVQSQTEGSGTAS